MGLIKDIYSTAFYNGFAATVKKTRPSFDERLFVKKAIGGGFRTMEWKERMNHTTIVLHELLDEAYPKALASIKKIIDQLRKEGIGGGLEHIFFADYISRYGMEDYRNSVKALEFVTQFISCEFAVRPFLIRYPEQMNAQMLKWSLHKSASVRRLSTEGIRPRLPWAIAVPALKADPGPVLPILENLKQDPSESVRRSVANNLNDIAKDHPGIVLQVAARWKGISPETDAIIKHGSRTLLKHGHAGILDHFGLSPRNLAVTGFKILTSRVTIGNDLSFTFNIVNNNPNPTTIRVEYVIWYLKANGQHAKKVFRIAEKIFPAQSTTAITRKQSFRLITTKTFYPGTQKLSINLNGSEKARGEFRLLK